jgi:lysophospholipase L1-like esterase
MKLVGALSLALVCALPAVGLADPVASTIPVSVSGLESSADCLAPEGTIASRAPLQRLSEALAAKQKLTILAIGSSSTEGVGASTPLNAYPAQMQRLLSRVLKPLQTDFEVVNRGVGGERAAETALRLRAEVERLQPGLVLWQVGTNDALGRISVEAFSATVRSTIAWAKSRNVEIVLVGLQFTPTVAKDDHYHAIKAAIARIAEDEGILLVRRYDAMQFLASNGRRPDMLASDRFHLNDLGYRCMAEHVARAIVSNLYLPKTDRKAALGSR